MPQMAPMNWLFLFFLFIMTFMIIMNLNFFSFSIIPFLKMKILKTKKIFWKW